MSEKKDTRLGALFMFAIWIAATVMFIMERDVVLWLATLFVGLVAGAFINLFVHGRRK